MQVGLGIGHRLVLVPVRGRGCGTGFVSWGWGWIQPLCVGRIAAGWGEWSLGCAQLTAFIWRVWSLLQGVEVLGIPAISSQPHCCFISLVFPPYRGRSKREHGAVSLCVSRRGMGRGAGAQQQGTASSLAQRWARSCSALWNLGLQLAARRGQPLSLSAARCRCVIVGVLGERNWSLFVRF